MKIDEFLSHQHTPRRKPRQQEHQLQKSCIEWFRHFNKATRPVGRFLFAIPNGGRRDATTGAMLKAEGVRAGVADLFLMIPSQGYSGLWIEMKTKSGRQSPEQKEFQRDAEDYFYAYRLCRSLDDFQKIINKYLFNL